MKKIETVVSLGIILLFNIFFINNVFAYDNFIYDDIIYINNKEDYIEFAENNEELGGYENILIELTSDIDFENDDVPVVKGEFKGVFDGNGYKLINIKLYSEEIKNLALFESNVGVIKKLIVDSGNISTNGSAAVIAFQNSGVIEQCANYVTVEAKDGVSGIALANYGYGTIRYCYNRGNIVSKDDVNNVLGLAGIVSCLDSGSVIGCYNTGDLVTTREGNVGNIVTTFVTDLDDTKFLSKNFCYEGNKVRNGADTYCLDITSFFINLDLDDSYYIEGEDGLPVLNMDKDIQRPIVKVSVNNKKEISKIFDYYICIDRKDDEDWRILQESLAKHENNSKIKSSSVLNQTLNETNTYVSIKKENLNTNINTNYTDNENTILNLFTLKSNTKRDSKINTALVVGGFLTIITLFLYVLYKSGNEKNNKRR